MSERRAEYAAGEQNEPLLSDAERTATAEALQRIVSILYTNHRGMRAWRYVYPLRLWFGATDWHPEEGWLLDAFDVERSAERTFAMVDIHQWVKVEARVRG